MCVCNAMPPAPVALRGRVLVLQHPFEEKCALPAAVTKHPHQRCDKAAPSKGLTLSACLLQAIPNPENFQTALVLAQEEAGDGEAPAQMLGPMRCAGRPAL